MKKIMTLAILAAVAVPFLAFGQSEEYYDRSYTRLSYVQGDVYIQRAQDLGYEQGEVNLVVTAGDKLGTRDGRAEIQLGRGNVMRLDRATQIDVAGLPGRDGDPTKIHVLAGSVFFRVRNADREKDLQIHTPDASFYVLEPGLYRVDVRDNERTEFAAFSGRAEAAGEEGSFEIEYGESVLAFDGRLDASSRLNARNDDFSSWNESRDEMYAKRLEKSYLPSEYADYEYELADNGSWAYENDYGYVWVPRVYTPEWRPYYHGRWSWYPVIGWTWIDYAPWGWCTSHYGRWGWRLGMGWFWIPTRHWGWGPAWVHWYNDWDYVGWCPLSYWDYPCWIYNNRFYGHGNHGGHGDFRDHVRTMTVVRRNQLQDRGISRVALDGRAGIKVDRISLKAKQPDLRPTLGRDAKIESMARRTLDRGSLRGVERSFNSSGRGRLSSPQLQEKSRVVRKSGSESASRRETVRDSSRGIQERILRPQTESRSGGDVKHSPERSLDRATMREYPSQSKGSLAGAAKRSFSSSSSSSDRAIRKSGAADRSSAPTIRYYSNSGRLAAPTERSSSASRNSSSSYRVWGSPSPDRSRFESRSSSYSRSQSPGYSSPRSSRSYSRPSLSPSRSRASGSSSRSVSSPSRSSSSRSSSSATRSSSSRSSSSASRSSSSSSRSSSSRSSGSSSRSSSGSRSSGSVHKR